MTLLTLPPQLQGVEARTLSMDVNGGAVELVTLGVSLPSSWGYPIQRCVCLCIYVYSCVQVHNYYATHTTLIAQTCPLLNFSRLTGCIVML